MPSCRGNPTGATEPASLNLADLLALAYDAEHSAIDRAYLWRQLARTFDRLADLEIERALAANNDAG